MDLKEFVKESLVQIIEGVKAAQDATTGTTARINPSGMAFGDIKGLKQYELSTYISAENIEFDIAVTVSEGESAKGGIAVLAGLIGGKAQAGFENVSSYASRIKFQVPVLFPPGKKT